MAKIAGMEPPKYELPFYRHVTRIVNSEGHSWNPLGENIMEAIDDLPAPGGTVYLPPKRLHIEDAISITKRVHLVGSDPTWHGEAGGTCLESVAGLAGENMIEYDHTSLLHFCTIQDMMLYNLHGQKRSFHKELG